MLSKLKNRRSPKGLYKISPLIVLIVVLMIGNLPASQAVAANAPDLFVGADEAAADLLYYSPDFVPRHRYVNVNLGLLFDQHGNSLDAKTTPEIILNLFPDTDYVGLVENVETDPDTSSTWYGSLKGVEGSYFYLVVTGGVFIAHIASTEGIYEVSWVADNLYRVVEIDQSKLGECALDEIEPVDEISMEESSGSTADELATLADSAATIDVIVFYTDDARLGEGSTAAMKARIQLAIQETNGSYANSGVQPRLRLVHVEEVSYAETGNIFTDVNRLQNTSDGYIDHIHNLRKKYGADMVALIVENGGVYCGVAKSTYANTQNAFQVTTRSGCMTGYYSFGHEFGHLQGARHDVYVDTSAWPYTFGHGYVHTHATTLSKRWRTIMAYNNKCSDLGYNCTRLQWWSNGNKQYLGASMGDNKARNFRVLNATAYNIANLVKQKIGNNFNSSFNRNSNGWQSVFGRWSLSQSMYFKTTGAVNKGTSVKHSNSYGDLTYRVKMKRTGSCKSCATRLIIRGNPDRLDSFKTWKGSYYFQYSNTGKFSVYKITSSGTAVVLRDWTFSTSIVPNDWNTLKVVAVGNYFSFYINEVLVWSGFDSSRRIGQVGIGMYRDSAPGRLLVDLANLSTTPIAGVSSSADIVESGQQDPGGTVDMAP